MCLTIAWPNSILANKIDTYPPRDDIVIKRNFVTGVRLPSVVVFVWGCNSLSDTPEVDLRWCYPFDSSLIRALRLVPWSDYGIHWKSSARKRGYSGDSHNMEAKRKISVKLVFRHMPVVALVHHQLVIKYTTINSMRTATVRPKYTA